jgi:gluconokinase
MVLILMGVAGSGKTTIGRKLSATLGCPFYDADDFHPPANIEKMRRGVPLDDADRSLWLERLSGVIRTCVAQEACAVFACSALKGSYRARLLLDETVKLVYLKGVAAVIRERLERRHGHFMKPEMLDSQLATLEEPEQAFYCDVNTPPEELVNTIRGRFGL